MSRPEGSGSIAKDFVPKFDLAKKPKFARACMLKQKEIP